MKDHEPISNTLNPTYYYSMNPMFILVMILDSEFRILNGLSFIKHALETVRLVLIAVYKKNAAAEMFSSFNLEASY